MNAVEQPNFTTADETVLIKRAELQDELSWLMLRVHRIRKLLGLEPIVTPRHRKRQQRSM